MSSKNVSIVKDRVFDSSGIVSNISVPQLLSLQNLKRCTIIHGIMSSTFFAAEIAARLAFVT